MASNASGMVKNTALRVVEHDLQPHAALPRGAAGDTPGS